jgi:hypothetical protein
MNENKEELYNKLVAKCPRFERKEKANPHTSANGHMFSQLNKDGELGIRFSKEVQEKYMKELANYLNESYGYVMSLEPK